jgi:ABC-type transport system involved in multi-copper enzyme maturation permease subunit
VSEIASESMPARNPLPWSLWWRQVRAILRLELRKGFRRAYGLYLLALAPIVVPLAMLIARTVSPDVDRGLGAVPEATQFYAAFYQAFLLRVVIFLACVAVFGNLIRRETLDRSLHYYFLSPLRRELLVAAKYLTGLIVSCLLFVATTVVTFVLTYAPLESTAVRQFLLDGHGLGHLAAYLLVTFLACAGYGAVFLFFGFFFKSPALPALAVFGWEAILFLLPPLLKKASVFHYLQSLCPVPVPENFLALMADAPSPWIAIPGLLVFAAVLVAVSAWKIRRMEITYDES